jgi:AmmeMemoRadiSam system protein A
MHQLVLLAKQAVETFIKERKIISPPINFPKEFLERKAGTFVTIEKNGELRGCIGTYLPTRENIAKEVIQNAIAAATEDYRFRPVEREELSELSYTVYILNEPELVKDLKELDPKKYGIIVRTETKTGLLLPDLEGVDTVEKQIAIACYKGGINPVKEKISIFKFTVEKFK